MEQDEDFSASQVADIFIEIMINPLFQSNETRRTTLTNEVKISSTQVKYLKVHHQYLNCNVRQLNYLQNNYYSK